MQELDKGKSKSLDKMGKKCKSLEMSKVIPSHHPSANVRMMCSRVSLRKMSKKSKSLEMSKVIPSRHPSANVRVVCSRVLSLRKMRRPRERKRRRVQGAARSRFAFAILEPWRSEYKMGNMIGYWVSKVCDDDAYRAWNCRM